MLAGVAASAARCLLAVRACLASRMRESVVSLPLSCLASPAGVSCWRVAAGGSGGGGAAICCTVALREAEGASWLGTPCLQPYRPLLAWLAGSSGVSGRAYPSRGEPPALATAGWWTCAFFFSSLHPSLMLWLILLHWWVFFTNSKFFSLSLSLSVLTVFLPRPVLCQVLAVSLATFCHSWVCYLAVLASCHLLFFIPALAYQLFSHL
jgi:hypothetical protein